MSLPRVIAATMIAAALCAGAWLRPVAAQDQPLPFAVGDKVRLLFWDRGAEPCEVVAIRWTFVLCAEREAKGEWLNFATSAGVDTKR